MVELVLKNRDLYDQLRANSVSLSVSSKVSASQGLFLYIKDKILDANLEITNDSFEEILKLKIDTFCSHLVSKWNSKGINRTNAKFLLKEADWLDMIFHIPSFSDTSTFNLERDLCNVSSCGRPEKIFSECSSRTKRRKTEELRASTSYDELIAATKTSLYKEGLKSAAELLGQYTEKSQSESVEVPRIIKASKPAKLIVPYTPEEALAFILNTGMTKDAYLQTRLGAKQRNADIYPTYEKVLAAKKLCYPEGVIVTDCGSEIPLQKLLNHTVTRLVSIIEIPQNVTSITLISKWGADGSSGHPEFMQKPQSEMDEDVQDSNLFLLTVVPLRIVGLNNTGEELLLWQNPRPSSTRLCRPIKFIYAKETAELIRSEINSIKSQILNLEDAVVTSENNQTVNCKFRLHLTMLDVQSINAITDNKSTQTCYLCHSKPTEMNDLSNPKHRNVNPDYLEYGLTTMHGWIKCLDCVLHIGYKLELKKPTIRNISSTDLEILELRKQRIHTELYQKLGIRVDKVVQGKGTSNTGNVARKFFTNYEEASRITGVNEELIRRFWIIMVALSSGYNLEVQKYDDFTKETASLYMEHYSWYRMPVSVHKIIVHGAEVAQAIMLPIGMMSEEAQEASNKVYKQVREKHTRKMDRSKTTTDLMHMMLAMSDPVISKARGLPKEKKQDLPKDVLPLIILENSTENDNEV